MGTVRKVPAAITCIGRRPRQTSEAKTAGLAVFGVTMVAQVGTNDDATGLSTAAARGGCVLAVTVLLGAGTMVKRGTDAVGEIV